MAAVAEAAGGLLGFVVVILAVIFAILAILMPYFVYRISVETERTNKLLRQLLKSYGQDPEG